MTNSRASGKFQLIDHHIATGTEATYTLTKNLDMKLTYREILIIITGQTTATLSMYMKLNGNTNYDESILTLDTTTVAGQQLADRSQIDLIDTSLLDGSADFHIKVTIAINDVADNLLGRFEAAALHEGQQSGYFEDQSTDTIITTIETLTSTSTWKAGTEITTYGILR